MRRILGLEVEPLFPESGPVKYFFFGEAPGPRGADKSGIPFWGDEAGKRLYTALDRLKSAEVPQEAFGMWDGAGLRAAGLKPTLIKAAISNSYNVCPTKDGVKFHRPTAGQLKSQKERVIAELRRAIDRCDGLLRVIAVGKVAERHLQWIKSYPESPEFDLLFIPHPSTQGLLNMIEDRGKGRRVADIELKWYDRLQNLLLRVNNERKLF